MSLTDDLLALLELPPWVPSDSVEPDAAQIATLVRKVSCHTSNNGGRRRFADMNMAKWRLDSGPRATMGSCCSPLSWSNTATHVTTRRR